MPDAADRQGYEGFRLRQRSGGSDLLWSWISSGQTESGALEGLQDGGVSNASETYRADALVMPSCSPSFGGKSAFEDGNGCSVLEGVGEAQMETLRPSRFHEASTGSVHDHIRGATGVTRHLDVLPGKIDSDACSQGLADRLLGSKPTGDMRCGMRMGQTVGHLFWTQNSIQELFPKTRVGVLNPREFNQVNSGSENHVAWS